MLSGKTIVITGVSSGIGARTAQLAMAQGAHVIGIDVKQPDSPQFEFLQGDLSTKAGIDTLVAALPRQVDALCNIAGLAGTTGLAAVLSVNFYGLRTFSYAVADRLRHGASVVNLASIAGYGWRANLERAKALLAVDGIPDMDDLTKQHNLDSTYGYPLSKELLLLWTQKAAHEPVFKSKGVRINAVSPGPVETPILRQFRAVLGDAKVDDDIERVGRAGTTHDVAPVVIFLASDAARWINGTNIATDGGLEASINAQTMNF